MKEQVCWDRFQSLLEIKLLELKKDAVFVEDDVEDFSRKNSLSFHFAVFLIEFVVFECFLVDFNVF
jgi:hypothetical protein